MKRRFLLAGLAVFLLRSAFGASELMVNGGFDLINAGEWHVSGTGAFITNGPGAFTGVGYLSMGNVANANQAAYQTITFPTNLISADFSLYYETLTSDTFVNDDLLSVWIVDTNHNILSSLGTTSNLSPTTGYVRAGTGFATYTNQDSLSIYAGKTVQVYFQVTTDPVYGLLTRFFIDNVSMFVGTTADIPTNDSFSARITLPTGTTAVSASGTNLYASKQTGEPSHAGNAGGHSVWWTWTASSIGTVVLDTRSSNFRTLVGVYTGSDVASLTSVASNNNGFVKFNVTPGTQYQIAVDGFNGQSGTIALSLKFTLDTKDPTVSITSPTSGAKVTNSTVIIQGKATDNVGIDLVEYRLENAVGTNDYQPADGTNTWSATVTDLQPGPNTIRVRATDTSDNVSTTVARTVNFVVVSPFTLTVGAGGTVTPNLGGQLLAVGANYKITAKPGPGNIFAGWSGDIVSDSASLTFKMQTNLTLQANFIPNPFGPVAGNYQGLFFDNGGASHESSGFFNATVTGAGAYSAKVMLGGVNHSFAGHFSATGASSNSIAIAGLPRVSVQLQLDLGGAGLSGEFSSGSWVSDLSSSRAMPSPPTGKYTVLLPGVDGDPTQPGGYGYGSVTVDALGKLSFAGALGDGTKVAQKTIVTPGGQWPLYLSPYAGKGSVLGLLVFNNQPDRDITGLVDWFKQAKPGKFYPAGFTNQNSAVGSVYSFTAGVPILNLSTGQVWFAGANIGPGFTNSITLSSANKVGDLSGNPITLSITTASGLFKGSVVNPDTGKPFAFSGVVLQKQNIGDGTFMGTNQTGRVHLGN